MNEEMLRFDSQTNQNEIEIQTSVFYDPLSDHNYFSKAVKTLRKKPKIVSLTAIYHCKICGFTTMKKEIIDQHRTTHLQVKNTQHIPCTSCNTDKKYPTGYLKCPNCNYFTQNRQGLKLHMNIHLRGKAIKCTDCDFYATDIKELVAHNKNGHGEKFECKFCEYRTRFRSRFEAHSRTHSGIKPFICSVCNYAAKEKNVLTRHMKTHIVT